MNIKTLLAGAAVAVVATLAAASANAGVTTIGSQAAFSAAGVIGQDTNWDAYGPGFFFPGSPVVVGDLTFLEGAQNLIGGVGTGYDLARNLFTDNNVAGTTINIAGSWDLFAFNLGNFFNADTAIVNLTTNVGSYTFSEAVGSAVNGGALSFAGFRADPGEHFTSVSFFSPNATGATDVQLGSVPEPAAWALMLTGFFGAGAVLRASRRRTAVATA
jgi:hypothetical protein